jgi:hypothetical protein
MSGRVYWMEVVSTDVNGGQQDLSRPTGATAMLTCQFIEGFG